MIVWHLLYSFYNEMKDDNTSQKKKKMSLEFCEDSQFISSMHVTVSVSNHELGKNKMHAVHMQSITISH